MGSRAKRSWLSEPRLSDGVARHLGHQVGARVLKPLLADDAILAYRSALRQADTGWPAAGFEA